MRIKIGSYIISISIIKKKSDSIHNLLMNEAIRVSEQIMEVGKIEDPENIGLLNLVKENIAENYRRYDIEIACRLIKYLIEENYEIISISPFIIKTSHYH